MRKQRWINVGLWLLGFWVFAAVSLWARSFTIVIDAGHGGKDPGARGARAQEKAINLSVALKLGGLIEQQMPDVKVIYTRKTDRFVELDERAELANRNKADLFLSIHTNAVKRGSSVQGTETYALGLARTDENLEVAMSENSAILLEENYQQRYEGFDPNSSESYIIFEFMQNKHLEQSVSLASEIQKAFKEAKRTDRGVRQAGFLVLRKTSMPSVLVELGYISNRQEEAYLSSSEGQQALAKALYQAFVQYKRTYDRRTTGLASTAGSMTKAVEPHRLEPIGEVTPAIQEGAGAPAPAGSEADIARKKQQAQRQQSQPQQTSAKQVQARAETKAAVKGKTVYKVQILTSPKQLPVKSSRLKGYQPVDFYVENGTYKYTYGETTDFSEIKQIRKRLLKDFKDAFIVAFKDGKKVKY